MAPAAASATVASARPLPFATGDAESFPWAGALLLLVLLAIAAWAWLLAARRGVDARPAWLVRASGLLGPLGQNATSPRLCSSTRLDAAARLHVVEWQGRQLLIAINGASPPVLLAERELASPS